jgi:hypothetical protein
VCSFWYQFKKLERRNEIEIKIVEIKYSMNRSFFNTLPRSSPDDNVVVDVVNDRVEKNEDGECITIIDSSSPTESEDNDDVIVFEKPSETNNLSLLQSPESNLTSDIDYMKSKESGVISDLSVMVEKKTISETEMTPPEDIFFDDETKTIEDDTFLMQEDTVVIDTKTTPGDNAASVENNDRKSSEKNTKSTATTPAQNNNNINYIKCCARLKKVLSLIHRRRTSRTKTLKPCLIEHTNVQDGISEKVAKIRGFGFTNEKVIRCALELANGDVKMALDIILDEKDSPEFKKHMENHTSFLRDQTIPSLQMALDLAVLSRSLGIVLTDPNSIEAVRKHLLGSTQKHWEENKTNQTHEKIFQKLRGLVYDVAVIRGIYDHEKTSTVRAVVNASEIRCARAYLETGGNLDECAQLLLENNVDSYENIESELLLDETIENYENIESEIARRALTDGLSTSFRVCTTCYEYVDIPYQSKRPRRPRVKSSPISSSSSSLSSSKNTYKKEKEKEDTDKDEEKEMSWDAASTNNLINLVTTHGMYWKKIGSITNRDPRSCFDKYLSVIKSSGTSVILNSTDMCQNKYKKSFEDFVKASEQIRELLFTKTTTTATTTTISDSDKNKKRKRKKNDREKICLDATTLALYGFYVTELHFKRGYIEERRENKMSELVWKILKSYFPRIVKKRKKKEKKGKKKIKVYSQEENSSLYKIIEEWPKDKAFLWEEVALRLSESGNFKSRNTTTLMTRVRRYLVDDMSKIRNIGNNESTIRDAVALSLVEMVNAVSCDETKLSSRSGHSGKRGGPWDKEDDERLRIAMVSFGLHGSQLSNYVQRYHRPCMIRASTLVQQDADVTVAKSLEISEDEDSSQRTDMDGMLSFVCVCVCVCVFFYTNIFSLFFFSTHTYIYTSKQSSIMFEIFLKIS